MTFDDHGLEGTRPACTVCADHPGWAHDIERSRREPADVCAACLGSGVKQDIDAQRVLNQIARTTNYARAALADEHEGEFTLSVKRLLNQAATLDHLVRTW